MIELAPGIYKLDLPLRNNPLKSLNCFFVTGEDSLIIDTGFNTEEGEALIREAMKTLGMVPEKTSLFLTHLHSDHTGLAARLGEWGIKIFMGETDHGLLQDSLDPNGSYWSQEIENANRQDLSQEKLRLSDHPGYKYRPLALPDIKTTQEGDVFLVGDYALQVIDLPGHTPGLQALYEPEHGFLFSGDHILERITPNITYWGAFFEDSLKQYLKSLDKVLGLSVTRVFSSHRELPTDHRARIEQIRQHHDDRLQECREILQAGPASVRDVTRQLHWDIRAKTWEDFPASQKWFAAGEAQAHLIHLRDLGEVIEEEHEGIVYYRLISS